MIRFARRIVCMLSAAMFGVALVARPAPAHPIHTTLSVLTPDAGGIVTITIRTFADDFSAAVARFAGRAAPSDSSAPAEDVVRYVRARLAFTLTSGSDALLEPCGVRRVREVYLLCFRVSLPAGTKGVRVRNGLLAELHQDQVNIVQLERGRERRTLLFTRQDVASALP